MGCQQSKGGDAVMDGAIKPQDPEQARSMVPSSSVTSSGITVNMIVERQGRDFRQDYSIREMIGTGSIGNIYLVTRKPQSFLSGSKSMRKFKQRIEDKTHNASDATAMTSQSSSSLTVEQNPDEPSSGRSGSSTSMLSSMPCYALKEIDMDRLTETSVQELENEVDLLRQIDHPNIIKLHEIYHDDEHLSILMEYCCGGDLNERAPYSEEQAQHIMLQLLQALNCLHKQGIMHRDLKFENIVFENDSDTAEIKLIDFGLSSRYGKREKLNESVGTVYTMAPEVINGEGYDQQADMWSVGVIAYQLLSGKKPFWSEEAMELAQLIVSGKYGSLEGHAWKKISYEAKDFIERLLKVAPHQRFTAEQALKSPWLNKLARKTKQQFPSEAVAALQEGILQQQQGAASCEGSSNMSSNRSNRSSSAQSVAEAGAESAAGANDFQRLAMQTLAHKAQSKQEPEVMALRQLFRSLDVNHDGSISMQEMKKGLGQARLMSASDIEAWFKQADVDANGSLNFSEFLAAALTLRKGQQQHNGGLALLLERGVADSFEVFDPEGKGYITPDNLRDVLGLNGGDSPAEEHREYIEMLIRQVDADGDGMISFTEFKNLLLDESSRDFSSSAFASSSHQIEPREATIQEVPSH